jgi:hypothetical protein
VAQRTGTASQVNASGGDGSTSVTVPSDATAVVALWAHYDSNGGTTLSSLTLNGVGFTIQEQIAEGATTDETGTGVATLNNPATGSQTFAWTWSGGGARAEGGWIVLVYVKDVDLASLVRDTATDAQLGSNDCSVQLTNIETTDLLLAAAQSFTGTNPALDGTVFINDAGLNSENYDVSEATGQSGTVTVNMTGENYSSMVAIALRNITAAPGAIAWIGAAG